MTLTRVVGKGRVETMDAAEFQARRERAARVAVDVGTGDGALRVHARRCASRLARRRYRRARRTHG